jgi:translation elongation factor EF-1alpha
MADFRVGKVTHYYDKLGVAVLELDADLGVGDKIKFVRGGEDLFEQNVSSMQVEHEKIENAKKGDIVGMKTDQPLKDGAEVFKLVS